MVKKIHCPFLSCPIIAHEACTSLKLIIMCVYLYCLPIILSLPDWMLSFWMWSKQCLNLWLMVFLKHFYLFTRFNKCLSCKIVIRKIIHLDITHMVFHTNLSPFCSNIIFFSLSLLSYQFTLFWVISDLWFFWGYCFTPLVVSIVVFYVLISS